MGGICGVVNYDGAPVDPVCLQSIVEKASSRGEGDIWYWSQGPVGLAYLASQTSPVSSSGLCSGGRLTLAADARLDNRAELRRNLTAGDCPPSETASDLELILAALACWGASCCEHLQGAYSLACWNEADASLVLLRDRLGERPLYWCSTSQGFFFASQPAQLLAVDSIDPAPNLERVLAYLLKQPFDPAGSFFRQINRLPEAHLIVVKNHQATVQQYWSPQTVPQLGLRHSEAAEALSDALEQAVRLRLATDGESGVLLSGGLDSSSIAAKAADILEPQAKQVYAFTWESQTGDLLDERKWSTSLIDSCPNLIEQPVMADGRYPLSRYPEAYLDPNAPNTNTYPDLLLTTIEMARQQGVRVLMNGVGGDLVIGGVLPELALLRQRHWVALAQRLRKSGRRGVRMLIRQMRTANRIQFQTWLSPKGRRLAQEAGLDQPAFWARELESPLTLRAFLLSQPLNATDLERFDRLSARHGVRITAPWYDLGLVSLVLGLPDGALDMYPPGKSLLRQAMANQLPAASLSTPVPKDRVAGLPAEGLLRHGKDRIVDWLSHSILGELELIDPAALRAIYLQATQSGKIPPGIWEVITLEIWLQIQYNNTTSQSL
jgi:asparagine synthase (glutamine-hydrolysing)